MAALSEKHDTPHHLRIDPALLTQGRVAVTEVVPFAHAGHTVVPGQVTPAPDGEAEIGSLVAGRLASLDAVEGQSVQKGQILAWLDAPEVGSARADLARAGAQAVAAQQRLDRQLALQSQGATSQGAVDEARAAVASAKADQQAAHAKLGSVGVGRQGATGRLPLRSPIDGIVVERRAMLGGAVAPDATLFRVINPNTLRVKAQWSETLGPIPQLNTRVYLSSRAGTSGVNPPACEATIETHLGVVDPVTRSVTVQVKPGSNCPSFTSGGYVDVLLASSAAAVSSHDEWVQVPLEAVVDLRGVPTVFVAQSEPGEFEARPVEPRPSLGGIVPIAIGLTAGEKVATKGVILLKGEALRGILGEH
jgi:cobalt-zinc-cadmium efflux system membrane fusion protein